VVLVCTMWMGTELRAIISLQKYLKKHKYPTLWNCCVTDYCECMDIAGELIFFFLPANLLNCNMTDQLQ